MSTEPIQPVEPVEPPPAEQDAGNGNPPPKKPPTNSAE